MVLAFFFMLGNGTKGRYGRKNHYTGEALPQCTERIHLNTRHEWQAGKWTCKQGSHPTSGAVSALVSCFLHKQSKLTHTQKGTDLL